MTQKVLYDFLINDLPYNSIKLFNWYELYSLVLENKAEYFLLKKLYQSKLLELLPKPILRQLYLSYKYNIHKNTILMDELSLLDFEMKTCGFTSIPYKGIYLIKNFYEDIGLRYMEDIDLIISMEHLDDVDRILQNSNYRLKLINEQPTDGNLIHPSKTSSALYKKESICDELVPFIKVDIKVLKLSDIEQLVDCNSNLLLQYQYDFLCESFYNAAKETHTSPCPSHCSLGKLIELIAFKKRYDKQLNTTISEHEKKHDAYFCECIEYFNPKEKIHEY